MKETSTEDLFYVSRILVFLDCVVLDFHVENSALFIVLFFFIRVKVWA